MKRKFIVCVTALFLSMGGVLGFAAPAPQSNEKTPIEIVADSLDYDSASGIINAQGNVVITQNNSVIKGQTAQYNSKAQESTITGGVVAVKDDITLTANEVRGYENNTHLIATGNPVLTKQDSTLAGPHIEYYSTNQYAVVTGGALMTMPDGTMNADKIDAFYNDDRAYGYGNVHLVSDTKKLDATADLLTYTGFKAGQGIAVLTGNARAVQAGNTITGDKLTLHLDDKAIDATGRPRLVIIPE